MFLIGPNNCYVEVAYSKHGALLRDVTQSWKMMLLEVMESYEKVILGKSVRTLIYTWCLNTKMSLSEATVLFDYCNTLLHTSPSPRPRGSARRKTASSLILRGYF